MYMFATYVIVLVGIVGALLMALKHHFDVKKAEAIKNELSPEIRKGLEDFIDMSISKMLDMTKKQLTDECEEEL